MATRTGSLLLSFDKQVVDLEALCLMPPLKDPEGGKREREKERDSSIGAGSGTKNIEPLWRPRRRRPSSYLFLHLEGRRPSSETRISFGTRCLPRLMESLTRSRERDPQQRWLGRRTSWNIEHSRSSCSISLCLLRRLRVSDDGNGRESCIVWVSSSNSAHWDSGWISNPVWPFSQKHMGSVRKKGALLVSSPPPNFL